jgi:guanylate kinase
MSRASPEHQASTATAAKDASRVWILCGPSGAGKTTLADRLVQQHPNDYAFAVSDTTRAPRTGEKEGVAYHFVDATTFETRVQSGSYYVEHVAKYGNRYGLSHASIQSVLSAGKRCVLIMEAHGCLQMRQAGYNPMVILVTAPSHAELRRRLEHRKDDPAAIAQRLAEVKEEEAYFEAHPDEFDFRIVNDDIDSAYAALEGARGGKAP